MKKLSFIIAAVAALFSVSCTQEKFENPAAGQEVDVTFTAQLPGNIVTKASYADGTTATELSYAVYNNGDTTPVHKGEATLSGKTANVHLKLVSGKTYDFIFWASAAKNTTYTVDFDSQTLNVDYDSMLASDETNDAFYAFVEGLKINGAKTEKVELYRPFAQVNLGTNDLNDADDDSFEVKKASMKATVASELNLATGDVDKYVKVEYAANKLPTEAFPVHPSEYDYLLMNYVLVGKEQTTIDCVFGIYDEGASTPTNEITVSNVPVKRNYRTNIYGSLITELGAFEVEIKPGLGEGDTNVDVNDVDENTAPEDFLDILEEGGNVSLSTEKEVIDFTGLQIKEDLTLILKKNVKEVILGGNNETPIVRSSSEKPNVTIVVSEGLAYPKFTFGETVENYTIKGTSTSAEVFPGNLSLGAGVKNFTVDGVRFAYTATANNQYTISANSDVDGLTVRNCVAENLGNRFVNVQGTKNVQILNNTIVCLDGTKDAAITSHPDQDAIYAGNVEGLLIKDNKITNSMNHHAIYTTGCKKVTITGNTVVNAFEDAIKVDIKTGTDATITNNTVAAKYNGIRVDNMNSDATVVITGNKISAKCDKDATYGINLKNGSATSHVLTIKNNTIGAEGIKLNRNFYINPAFTPTGDYEMPFEIIDGVGVTSDGAIGITNAAGLKWVADVTNGVIENNVVDNNHSGDQGAFQGQTVKLLADIDLDGIEWNPIGKDVKMFAGNFEGNNHTISNLKFTSDFTHVGLFGYSLGSIKNLTLKNVDITGKIVGAVAGAVVGKTVENCHVIGGRLTGTSTNNVGGIVGLSNESSNNLLKNNSVKSLTITSGNNAAGIAGATNAKLEGNTVENVKIFLNNAEVSAKHLHFGEFVGWDLGATVADDNKATNVTVELEKQYIKGDGKYYDTLDEALSSKEIWLPEGEYKFTGIKTDEVKIIGESLNTKIDANVVSDSGAADATFENVTIVASQTGYVGMQHMGQVTFNDCVIENQFFCYSGEKKTIFNDCTFKQDYKENYNIWTYGSNVDFNYCTFESAGKSVLVYTEADGWSTVNLKNCIFNASAPVQGKAAVEVTSTVNTTIGVCKSVVNIENCTANGFAAGSVSGNTLFNIKDGSGPEYVKLTATLADGVKFCNPEYQISNGKGLAWASENLFTSNAAKTVSIMNDIDMSGVNYTPAVWTSNTGALTLNGNSKVISNLTVNGARYAGLLGRVSNTVVINDLTIKDSHFAAEDNPSDGENTCGAFIALYGCYISEVESALNNCKVIDVTYGTAKYLGGLVGWGNMSGAHALLISDCKVDGADITSEYTEDGTEWKGHCGGFVGGTYNATIQNSEIKNSIITVKGPRYGSVIGSIQGGTAVFGEGIVVENVTINGEKATSANVVGAVNNTNCDSSVVTVR